MKLVYREKDSVIIDLGEYSGNFGMILPGRIYCSRGENDLPEEILRRLNIAVIHNVTDTYDQAMPKIGEILSTGRYPVLFRFGNMVDVYSVNLYLMLYLLGLSSREAQNYTLEIVRTTDQKNSPVQSLVNLYYTYSGSDDGFKKKLDIQLQKFHQSYAYPEKFFVSVCGMTSEKLQYLRKLYIGSDPLLSGLSGSDIRRIHCIVRGKVQGVGFRSFAAFLASEYGITGTVDNLYDGSVEIYAQGQADQLHRYFSSIRKGNRFIRVKQMDIEDTEVIKDETSFRYMNQY